MLHENKVEDLVAEAMDPGKPARRKIESLALVVRDIWLKLDDLEKRLEVLDPDAVNEAARVLRRRG